MRWMSLPLFVVTLGLAGCPGAGFDPQTLAHEVGPYGGLFTHTLQNEGATTTQYTLALSEADQDIVLLQIVGLGEPGGESAIVIGDEGVDDEVVDYQSGGTTSLLVQGAADVEELRLGTAVRGSLSFDGGGTLAYLAHCKDEGSVTLTAATDPPVAGGDESITIDCSIGESTLVVNDASQTLPVPGGGYTNDTLPQVSFLLAPTFPSNETLAATERYLLVVRDTAVCTDPFETNTSVFYGRTAVGVLEGSAGVASMPSPIATGDVSVWTYAYSGAVTPCQTDGWCASDETCELVEGGVGICMGNAALQAGGCATVTLGESTDCGRGDGSSFNGCATLTLAAPM